MHCMPRWIILQLDRRVRAANKFDCCAIGVISRFLYYRMRFPWKFLVEKELYWTDQFGHLCGIGIDAEGSGCEWLFFCVKTTTKIFRTGSRCLAEQAVLFPCCSNRSITCSDAYAPQCFMAFSMISLVMHLAWSQPGLSKCPYRLPWMHQCLLSVAGSSSCTACSVGSYYKSKGKPRKLTCHGLNAVGCKIFRGWPAWKSCLADRQDIKFGEKGRRIEAITVTGCKCELEYIKLLSRGAELKQSYEVRWIIFWPQMRSDG